MHRVVLNFFPLATDRFKIQLYRIPYAEGDQTEFLYHGE